MVCIASGPSLTADDCASVLESGHPTIVTNTSFRLAPWADVLFAFDGKWWRAHMGEVQTVFKGRRMSVPQVLPPVGVEYVYGVPWFRQFGNSGACAVSVAIGGGATKVVLLGYDCGFALDGKKHWHADHPKGLSNCASFKQWPQQFRFLADYARSKSVEIVNASRETTLRHFPRVALADAL